MSDDTNPGYARKFTEVDKLKARVATYQDIVRNLLRELDSYDPKAVDEWKQIPEVHAALYNNE